MFLKSLKLVVFAFLIIGPLVPALAVAEVMVQFNTGFFGTVGKNTQKAEGISLMSNYDIDLIEVTQDLGDGSDVFQIVPSTQIQGNDIPVNLIIHQGASKTTLEGTVTWLWQPKGAVIMLGFVSNAGVKATITETNPDSGQAPKVYLIKGNSDGSNDLERGEPGDTNIGLIFRGQTEHTFVDNEDISGSANLNAVLIALNNYAADPVSQPANPALGITKTGTLNDDDGTTGLSAGDTISYAFTVTNTGNTTLTNIEVTDPKATVTGTTIASLAPGASDTTSYTARYTLLQADIDMGTFTNTATATGDGAGTDDVTDTDSDTQTLAPTGSLTLIKTASDPADNDSNGVDVGDVITYTYVATNSGNVTLTNVSIAETQADFTGTGTLPSPVYASGGSDQDSDSATDDLAVGESVTWTATYALTQADVNAGFVENQAKATGSSPSGTGDVTDVSDDDGTNASDKTRKTFTGSSALTLIKTASDPADNDSNGVDVGDVITYTYVATNSGNVTLTNVSIAETQADFTGTGTLPSPVYASGGSDQDSDSATDDLAVGESVTWTATYALTQADVNAGFVENQAKATGSSPSGTGDVTDVSDDDGTNASDKTRKTFTGSSALTLIKTASDPADNDSNGVDVGDVITYTYVATNSGNVTLTNVSIAETQADFTGTGTLPSPVYASGGSDQDSDSATDDLAVGESVTWTATYALTQADVNAGFVENQAKATGSSPSGTGDVTDVSDDDGTNASDKTRKTFTGSSALTLIKTASDPADNDSNGVDVGDVITYTYVATNSGNVTLTNVSIAETQADFTGTGTLPSPVYASGGSDQDSDSATDDLAVGESVTWTATYALTQADVNAGFVENQAKATGSSPSGTGDVTDVSDDDGTNASDKTRKTFTGSSALTLIKTASDPADNDSNGVDVGDVITYTYVATNSGNVTLTNVSIAETQADFTGTGTLPSPVYASGGSDQDSDSATDDLAVGESVTWTATYALTQADVNAGFVENQAKATGSNPGNTGDVTDLSDDDGTNDSDKTKKSYSPVSNQTLAKAVTSKTGTAGAYAVGDVVTYTVTQTNTGNVTLNNVVITDAKLTASTTAGKTGSCASVAPGATCVLEGTYKITQTEKDAGTFKNTASVKSTEIPTALEASNTITLAANAKPTLSKALTSNADEDKTSTITVGDTLTYTVTLLNDGDVTLTDTTITDDKISPSSKSCSSVAVNGTCVLTGTYKVTQADVDAGKVTNNAESTSKNPAGTTLTRQAANTETITQSAAQTLAKAVTSKTGTAGAYAVGDVVTYTVTQTNTGNVTLNNVVITDAKLTASTTAGKTGKCASVVPGATCVLEGTYTITQTEKDAGTFKNTASVKSTEIPTALEASNTITLAANAKPTLSKALTSNADEDKTSTITVGDTLTYTVTLLNDGDVTLTDTTITDDKISPSSKSCSSVAVNGTCVLTGTYKVTQADVDAGKVTNNAESTSKNPAGTTLTRQVANTETITQSAAQTLAKAVTSKTGTAGAYAVGDVVTYTITQTNTGNVTLNNVVITDAKLTASTTAGKTGSCASVAPGATCVLEGTYKITQTEKDAGTFKNTASVKSTEIPTALEASNTITLAANAKPTLSKALTSNADEDKTSTITVGDTLTYTVTLLNDGDVTLTDTTITDDKISPSSKSCSSVAVNGTCVLTGTYKVTQADVDAGKVTNNAESTSKNPAGTTLTRQAANTETITQSAAQTLAKAVTSKTGTAGAYAVGDVVTYTDYADEHG